MKTHLDAIITIEAALGGIDSNSIEYKALEFIVSDYWAHHDKDGKMKAETFMSLAGENRRDFIEKFGLN